MEEVDYYANIRQGLKTHIVDVMKISCAEYARKVQEMGYGAFQAKDLYNFFAGSRNYPMQKMNIILKPAGFRIPPFEMQPLTKEACTQN